MTSPLLCRTRGGEGIPARWELRSSSLCSRVYPRRKEECQKCKARTSQITSAAVVRLNLRILCKQLIAKKCRPSSFTEWMESLLHSYWEETLPLSENHRKAQTNARTT